MDPRIPTQSLFRSASSTVYKPPPPDPDPPGARYYLGCDPGQSIDPTAIAAVRVTQGDRGPVFECGHLERLPLNTPYPGIATRVLQLLGQPPFLGKSDVVLDLTGVGRPVNDLFEARGIHATCVTITAGHDETSTGALHWSVPKITLVSRVQTLLHDGRLLIQKDLADTPAPVAELQDFRATVTDAGHWRFGARSGAHDDLVLALALACWAGSRLSNRPWAIPAGLRERLARPDALRPHSELSSRLLLSRRRHL